MEIIGKSRGNDLVGIAWDDEYFEDDERREHILFDLRERLEAWRIEIRATNKVNEFRSWMATEPYQFVLLDMVREYASGPKTSDWTGLDLLEELRTSPSRPGVPVIMVTGVADHLRQQSYMFRSNEYLKSKYLTFDWLATEILEILEYQAVRVVRDKIAVFDNAGDGRAVTRLTESLATHYERSFGEPPQIYQGFQRYPTSAAEVQSVQEELRECLAFVAVRELPGGTEERAANDDFLLRLGMALAEPRGVQRLIVIDNTDEPPALPLVQQALRIRCSGPDLGEPVKSLLARFSALRQPGCA